MLLNKSCLTKTVITLKSGFKPVSLAFYYKTTTNLLLLLQLLQLYDNIL
jgi:hypothetical protein